MESPTPVSRYVNQNSKKRVLPGGSSSSVCKDVEVLDITPAVKRTSKPKSSRHDVVLCNERIEVDSDEDIVDLLIPDDVDLHCKGKEAMPNISSGLGASSNDGSGIDSQTSINGVSTQNDPWNINDFDSSLLIEDFKDDYASLESHFDHMDIPPGIAVPFPWLPSCPKNKIKAPATSNSTKLSTLPQLNGISAIPYLNSPDYASLESHFDHMDIPPGIEAPFPWLPICTKNKIKALASSNSTKSSIQPHLNGISAIPYLNSPDSSSQLTSTSRSKRTITTHVDAGIQSPVRKLPLKWFEPSVNEKKSTSSSGSSFFSTQSSMGPPNFKCVEEPFLAFGKSERRTHSPGTTTFIGPSNLVFPGPTYPPFVYNSSNSGASLNLNLPLVAPAIETSIPQWQDLPANMMTPLMGPVGYFPEFYVPWSQPFAGKQNHASPMATPVPITLVQRNIDDVQRKFGVFKKFDMVEDCLDHQYFENASLVKEQPKNWAKKIQDEWKILEKDLPDAIFVRVYESRMDLLRAVIVGAEGTPYHNGLFFFDIFFPSNYPNVPPLVHYHSGGLRINPNLYNCGKVCLSLLNTWSGSDKEKWIPGVSTMLQVLVSIQGLILNAKPYFNEPGYSNLSGSINGEKRSVEYNENTFIHSLQTMLYSMRRPPKHFEDLVMGHYCKYARDILVSCKAYMDGAQVGCLASGGIQDFDEGDKYCSQHFKNSLAGFIPVLANTFSQIGAKNCEEFRYLAQKSDEQTTAHPPHPVFSKFHDDINNKYTIF